MFFEISVLKTFAIFTGKHVLQSLFNKSAGLQACKIINKETPTQVFLCVYCEIFKNGSYHCRWLLFLLLCCALQIWQYWVFKLFLHWIFLRFTSADSYLHVFSTKLTQSFPLHPFSTDFQGVEKGCIGNEWVKEIQS